MKNILLRYLLVFFLPFYFLQCSTIKKTKFIFRNPDKIKALSNGKLYDSLSSNELKFKTLLVKKATIALQINNKTKNFSATIEIKKDNQIWLTANGPLGLEILRFVCTPDSIKLLNRLKKKYILTDYSYLADSLGIDLSYEKLQAILTNSIFTMDSYDDKKSFIKNFKGRVIDNKYVFHSKYFKKIKKKIRKKKQFKLKKLHDIIEQSVVIQPLSFRILQINVNDFFASKGVTIKYDDFNYYNNNHATLFPHKIFFQYFSPDYKVNADIKVHKVEFDKIISTSFNIPKKYKPID